MDIHDEYTLFFILASYLVGIVAGLIIGLCVKTRERYKNLLVLGITLLFLSACIFFYAAHEFGEETPIYKIKYYKEKEWHKTYLQIIKPT